MLRVKSIQRNNGLTAKSENLGRWWNAWRTSSRDGRQWRICDTDVTGTFFPKIFVMNESTTNYFKANIWLRRELLCLKKAFTRIRTTLPQKTNRVQSSLHRVKPFLHLLSNSSPPSQKRGFLHETGILHFKFSTSHFIDARLFFKVPTLKWCVFLLNEILQQNKSSIKHRI